MGAELPLVQSGMPVYKLPLSVMNSRASELEARPLPMPFYGIKVHLLPGWWIDLLSMLT